MSALSTKLGAKSLTLIFPDSLSHCQLLHLQYPTWQHMFSLSCYLWSCTCQYIFVELALGSGHFEKASRGKGALKSRGYQ